MTPEQWEQISEIYHSALEIDSSERRKAFLERMCANDEFLRREVESLLAADSELGDFIAEPVVKDIAPLLTAENAPSPSLAGKSLGHYRIVSLIGLGGMGEVYLAKDSKLNRSVAIKTLPVSLSGDPNHLRRFQTEAKAAATLNHPNVATIYSVEEIGNQPFITMEYVEGKSLDTFIPAGGLDLKTFLEWFVPLADALSHAHEKGIIHRDIKPGNIMITAEGVPKILDFGLAQIDKAVTAAASAGAEDSSTLDMTEPGQIFGTPSYMSPEQAEGRQVDHRSDIFSLGVVMYQALAGERPFRGSSYAAIVSELMTKEPRAVGEIKTGTPFLLSRLVMRCLCKDRRKRFQSMREVRAILEETKASVEAGESLKSSSLRFLKSKSKSSGRGWILAPLALLAIVAASFALYRFFQDKPPQSPISFENMTLRKLSQTNNVAFAQITPDGKSIVYTTIDENDGRALWVRRVDDKNALQLLAPQPVFFWGGLTVSADGSQIYYIIAERDGLRRALYRVSSLGGAPRKLVETVNDLGSLSPDGQRILYVRYGEKQVQILSANAADGGDERVIRTGKDNEILRDPRFSLDGKSIFFIKFERIDGEEFWSLVETPAAAAAGGEDRVILPLRKPRISEIVVLKDGSGLLVNATDAVSNLQQLFHVSLPSGLETRITNDLNAYFGISASDDGKTIVATQRQNLKDIWLAPEGDADNLRKLTSESNVYTSAVWTADGRIVYDAVDNNRPHVWIMNGDGSGAQQLTPNDSFDYEPRVSPDGRHIVFTSKRGGETKIWRMNIDGSNPQILTAVVGATFAPVVMPDGQTILFQWSKENGRVMGSVPLSGGAATEIAPISPNSNLLAVSPDGKQVAFPFYDAASGRYKVRVRPLETEEPAVVFDITPTTFLQWTVDGKGLLYRELDPRRNPSSTVMFQPVAGGDPKPFLSVKSDSVLNVSQSRDGRQTLVVRDKFVTDAVMLTQIRSN
ncbi:MAG TPA: protein kinase [Pyrinomonadaceae bacterium]|jgi:serine/threonine protein kinase/WD40 repeat protein